MRVVHGDAGATSTEYALLAAFIAVVAAVSVTGFGMAVLDLFAGANVTIPW